ncbi:ABC transporter ATP-binding protein [Micromonospora sp. NPDC005299]|uniref:ABC transporter ATP-binding protein n=1 Tax=Micromonospora sp. NPDC005299 TaxID=3364231 RepID=UPI0036AE3685
MSGQPDREALLSVRDLVVEFAAPDGFHRAVDGVSFNLYPDEVLGVVGESGSGKSVTMLAVMGLLPPARARVVGGEIWYRGRNLLTVPRKEFQALRGGDLSMIFQDPMTSLNPVRRVGSQIAEAIRLHRSTLSRSQVRDRVVELLGVVGVPAPERRYRQYPHEYSGGMRQRAMIAMAIANEPSVLIADEPTTALDVTIQAQVLDVLAEARGRTGASVILITHDLGLIAETADRVAVMYGGRVMELTGVEEIFAAPRHPYTVGLLASLPKLDSSADVLYSIPGQPPGIRNRPSGCVFHPRCGMRQERVECVERIPVLEPVGDPGSATPHSAACHFVGETAEWRQRVSTDEVPAGNPVGG